MFGCNGTYMYTFTGKQLWVCGFGSDPQWIRQTRANGQFPNPFPGAMPVNSFSSRGDMTDVIIVVAGDGVLWECGIPAGDWEMFAPQPPTNIVFKQFLGGRWNPDNNDWYIAFLDTALRVWMIGNPERGGEWVAPQNLVPQSDWGPFGYNTGPYMWAFSGNTLQVCAIDVV